MVQIIADKGTQGVTLILESGDEEIMTYNQAQANVNNASEVNSVTIAPVPAGKTLYITNVTMFATSTADVQFYNSPNSASITGATQIGSNYVTGSDPAQANATIPCFWKIDAGRYFVIREGSGGGTGFVFCRGVLV